MTSAGRLAFRQVSKSTGETVARDRTAVMRYIPSKFYAVDRKSFLFRPCYPRSLWDAALPTERPRFSLHRLNHHTAMRRRRSGLPPENTGSQYLHRSGPHWLRRRVITPLLEGRRGGDAHFSRQIGGYAVQGCRISHSELERRHNVVVLRLSQNSFSTDNHFICRDGAAYLKAIRTFISQELHGVGCFPLHTVHQW